MEPNKFDLNALWREHKWAIVLAALFFLFAVCVISYGFFKALFLFLCVAVGIYVGWRLDKRNKDHKSEDLFDNGR